jgi:hypothetical protein
MTVCVMSVLRPSVPVLVCNRVHLFGHVVGSVWFYKSSLGIGINFARARQADVAGVACVSDADLFACGSVDGERCEHDIGSVDPGVESHAAIAPACPMDIRQRADSYQNCECRDVAAFSNWQRSGLRGSSHSDSL